MILEIIPLMYGQYILVVDQPLVLLLPSMGSVFVVFLLLMDLTERYAQHLLVSLARLLRPILLAVIIVAITQYLFFFVSVDILLLLLMNTAILDNAVLSYAIGQIISVIACTIASTEITQRILKR